MWKHEEPHHRLALCWRWMHSERRRQRQNAFNNEGVSFRGKSMSMVVAFWGYVGVEGTTGGLAQLDL